MLCIFAGLEHALFPKTNRNIQRFQNFLSFCLDINYNEFITNAVGSQLTSVAQVQKYAARAK